MVIDRGKRPADRNRPSNEDDSNPPIGDLLTSGFWPRRGCSWLLIMTAVIAAYSQSLNNGFVFDDEASVVENQSIRSIWPLSTSLWAAKDAPTAGRPIVNFSFALNYAIGELSPFGYHLMNVLLHTVNAILLMEWLYRTIGGWNRPKSSSVGAWRISSVIALVWALHPIQTESVAYVTQRTELMMAFFFLTTMYSSRAAWDAAEPARRIAWEVVSVLSCALGMASKEVMVAAPLMVVAYDLTVLQAERRTIVSRRWRLYLGLLATWVILAALLSTNPRGGSVGFGHAMKPIDYLTTQFWAIVHYLGLVIWPTGLCSDYGVFTITDPKVWLPCLILLLALAALTMGAWWRRSPLAFAGLWFFAILAPTSSFVPIVSEPIAERRIYLPLAAIVTLAVIGIVRLGELIVRSPSPVAARWGWGGLGLGIGAVYAIATFHRNSVYENELTFWTDVVAKRPDNSRGYTNLGLQYAKDSKLELAKASFRRAIELAPDNADAHLNLGVYAEEGELDQAISYYEQTIALNPKMDRAYCNLGNCYAKQGRVEEALQAYEQALSVTPTLVKAWYSRGVLLFSLQRWDEAIRDFSEAVRLDPTMAIARFQMGNVYLAQKRYEEAAKEYRQAIEVNPQLAGAHLNLAVSLIRQTAYATAIEAIQQALKIEPNNADAYSNLALCHASLGDFEQAIAAYRKCVEIQPGDAQAWYRLGKLYVGRGEKTEARRSFERVLLIDPKAVEATRQLEQLDSP